MNKLLGFIVVAALPTAAYAGTGVKTGTFKGSTYTAKSTIIGQTSTATQAPPLPPGKVGNPIYYANDPKYSGVVQLVIHEASGNFLCSGSLLGDNRTVVTAGHCVSSGKGVITAQSVEVYFNDHSVDTINYLDPKSVVIPAASIRSSSLYTGEVIDDHDIAIIKLASDAPSFAKVYSMYTGELVGTGYNTAGFGLRSDQGGSVGANLGPGRIRQGDNRYDFTFGDPAFGGFFDGGPGGFFGTADTSHTYISDFDSGLFENDSSCLLGVFGFGGSPAQFCDPGRGDTEVSTAPGDSGGPQFVNGQLASLTSFGLTFGSDFGDIDDRLNDTFGEYNGLVSLAYNAEFIAGVPEPATWAMMIAGFALVGGAMRRRDRRSARVSYAG